jgi:hypothetical protein
MMAFPIAELLWRARRLVQGRGAAAVAGALLLFGCAAFAAYVVVPQSERLAQARGAAASAKVRPQSPTVTAISGAESELAKFYRYFPERSSTNDLLEKIFAVASAQGLVLEQGEYQLQHEQEMRLTRLGMVLPVKGSYPQIRQFVSQALRDIPNLSLDGITYTRQRVEDVTVEAQVRMTLFVGRE